MWLIDDNDDPESSAILAQSGYRIFPATPKTEKYVRDEITHRWSVPLTERVGAFKDWGMTKAMAEGYESVFLVDADLALHPHTLTHLLSLDLPIVTEVFWTRFNPVGPLAPQVWDYHPVFCESPESIVRLREPGQYKVGGYGACTLVRREVVLAGGRFAPIPGVGYYGEDRHFGVRAAVLGFQGWADTYYPPFHMFRPRDVAVAREWLAAGAPPDYWRMQLDNVWERRVRSLYPQFHPLMTPFVQ